jgi:CRP/FNR family transcriptional regulator
VSTLSRLNAVVTPLNRNHLVPTAERGSLGDLVRLMGAHPASAHAVDERLPVTLWRVRQGTTLIHEGSQGHALYVVRCGSLKCVKTLEDGYEQVLSFVQAGGLMGFEALHNGVQPASVVALEDSSVYALPVRDLHSLQESCPAVSDALHRALSRQLVHASETAEMMAAVASDVRLARFVLWWSARMAEAGQSPRRLHLRMGRRDIASLLGVAHETVSRSFTTLADAGLLQVENRDVEIIDLDGLRARARSTRGMCNDPSQHACAAHPAHPAHERSHEPHPAAERAPQLSSVWSTGMRAMSDN